MLPTISTPKYSVTLTDGQSVEYRPFTVKEEKILHIAGESGDDTSIFKAILDVVQTCTYDKVDLKSLSSYDFEYIFLKIRAKSVGETSKVVVKCPHCNADYEAQIDIDSICPTSDVEAIEDTIQITDTIQAKLKPVTLADVEAIQGKSENDMVESLIAVIEYIADDSKIYRKDDIPHSEWITFVESLSRPQISKIEAYVQSLPSIKTEIADDCKVCKKPFSIVIEGLQSFFD